VGDASKENKPPSARGAPSSPKSSNAKSGGRAANSTPRSSTGKARPEPKSAHEDRDFAGLDDFDDWTEEDWADLERE